MFSLPETSASGAANSQRESGYTHRGLVTAPARRDGGRMWGRRQSAEHTERSECAIAGSEERAGDVSGQTLNLARKPIEDNFGSAFAVLGAARAGELMRLVWE